MLTIAGQTAGPNEYTKKKERHLKKGKREGVEKNI